MGFRVGAGGDVAAVTEVGMYKAYQRKARRPTYRNRGVPWGVVED